MTICQILRHKEISDYKIYKIFRWLMDIPPMSPDDLLGIMKNMDSGIFMEDSQDSSIQEPRASTMS